MEKIVRWFRQFFHLHCSHHAGERRMDPGEHGVFLATPYAIERVMRCCRCGVRYLENGRIVEAA